VNDTEPDAPVESLAVTFALKVPLRVGLPEIKPLELMCKPVGRWGAFHVSA